MDSMGDRIAEARKAKKITQEELGKRIGVAKSTVSGYEAGNRRPDSNMLLKLARTLNVSVDYLIGHDYIWVNKLPPDLQEFVTDENNKVLLHMAKEIKDTGILPETIVSLARALVADAKKRLQG